MNAEQTKSVIMFAATAFAAWVLYKLYDKISAAGGKVGDAIGDFIGPIVAGPLVQVNAGAVLPSGATVSFNDIVKEGGTLKNEGGEVFTFNYRGSKYRLVPPRRDDGLYNAVRV